MCLSRIDKKPRFFMFLNENVSKKGQTHRFCYVFRLKCVKKGVRNVKFLFLDLSVSKIELESLARRKAFEQIILK